MFNDKTLPARSGSLKTISVNDFSSLGELSYNVRETEDGIENGYGFEQLKLPNDDSISDVAFSTESEEITGIWQFAWYDSTDNVDKYYVYFINENHELQFFNIFGDKSMYITNITLNTDSPSFAAFRINVDNDMAFFSSDVDQTVGHSGSGRQVFNNIPKFVSACWYGPYLFLVTVGDANKLMYSTSNINIWNDDNTSEVVIPDLRGGMKKIISVNDNLYLFYEFGVVKLSLYSIGSKISYSHIFNSTARIYENTIAKCGNSVYFMTSEGFFILKNGQVEKMETQPDYICKSNEYMCAECYENKYFIACACDFGDGKQIGVESETYKNNAMIVFDAQTKKFSYTRGIDILSFLVIKTPSLQRLCATTRGANKNHIAQLTTDGKFFGAALPKCWQSRALDFNSLDEKEILQINFKGSGNGDMLVTAQNRSRKLKMSNSQPAKYKIKLFGDQFKLSFSSDADIKITYPQIKVKHFS